MRAEIARPGPSPRRRHDATARSTAREQPRRRGRRGRGARRARPPRPTAGAGPGDRGVGRRPAPPARGCERRGRRRPATACRSRCATDDGIRATRRRPRTVDRRRPRAGRPRPRAARAAARPARTPRRWSAGARRRRRRDRSWPRRPAAARRRVASALGRSSRRCTRLHDADGRADLGALGRLAGGPATRARPSSARCRCSPRSSTSPTTRARTYRSAAAGGTSSTSTSRTCPSSRASRCRTAVGSEHLDHRATMAARRRALEVGLRRGCAERRARAAARFEATHPEVHTYARFRGRGGAARPRPGPLARPAARSTDPTPVDEARERYHRYVQFAARRAAPRSPRRDARPRPDALPGPPRRAPIPPASTSTPTPMRSHAARPPARRPTASSPPGRTGDSVRRTRPVPGPDGYRDLRRALARHFEVADVVRLDHVMGLQRLWWIPDGAPAADGAYVRYPMEELFAVVCAEAARVGATVVGEDLGTVSPTIERALARHRVVGMYVGQFAVDPEREPPLTPRRHVGASRASTRTTPPPSRASGPAPTSSSSRPSARSTPTRPPACGTSGRAADRARGDRCSGAWPTATPVHARRPTGGAPRLAGPCSHPARPSWCSSRSRTSGSNPTPRTCPAPPTPTHRNWSRRLARATDALDTDARRRARRSTAAPASEHGAVLTETDVHLFHEGRLFEAHRSFGAHADPRRHPLHRLGTARRGPCRW